MAKSGLAATQLGLLVHELAHVYGAMPWEDVECGVLMEEGSVLENTELYEAQECAELGAEVQVKHAQNYALFASGEFSLSWFWFLVALFLVLLVFYWHN